MPPPVVPPPAGNAPAEELPDDAPAAEETPAPAEEQPAAAEAPPEAADEISDDEDGGGDGPVTPISKNKIHLRIKDGDEVGRLQMAYMKRNRDMTAEEAMTAAKRQLGVKPEVTPPPDAAKAPDPNALPDTIEGVDSAIDQVEAKRQKAYDELNFAEMAKIDAQLRRLERQRLSVERNSEREQSARITQYNEGFGKSEAKAVELYEFAGQPDSPAGRRMVEIEAALRENQDPLYFSPDKPLRVAQMVASEMKIAPRGKGKPAAPVKAAQPAPKPAPKQMLPGGNSGTAPKLTSQPAEVAAIRKIGSHNELRAYRKSIGLPEESG